MLSFVRYRPALIDYLKCVGEADENNMLVSARKSFRIFNELFGETDENNLLVSARKSFRILTELVVCLVGCPRLAHTGSVVP